MKNLINRRCSDFCRRLARRFTLVFLLSLVGTAHAGIVSVDPTVFKVSVKSGGAVGLRVLLSRDGNVLPQRQSNVDTCAELADGAVLGLNARSPCNPNTVFGRGQLQLLGLDGEVQLLSALLSPAFLATAANASAVAGRALGSRRFFLAISYITPLGPQWAVVRIDLDEPAPNGIVSASSGLIDVALAGPTPVAIRYGFAGRDAPLSGQFCSTLITAYPPNGVVDRNPCAPGSTLGSAGPALGYVDAPQSGEQLVVPESIARIAVQQARVSGNGIFFFVRRFTSGQYAVVRLRLTGDSASNPVVFTDIRLAFEHGAGSQSIGFFKRGQPLPQPSATLRYRGAGIIRARWEVVVPGEELPNALDLRSEASLTPQDRVRQHRYRVLSRVQVFLPPNGGGVLRGPDPKLLPNEQYGQYLLLLRIESTDSMAGTPSGMAPFALPVLRYFIGESNGPPATDAGVPDDVALLAPSATVAASRAAPAVFEWREMREAALYRLEIGLRGRGIFSARVLPDPQAESNQYTAPPFIVTGLPERGVRWRVLAFAADGRLVGHSPWRDWFLQPSTEPESNSTQPRRGAFLGFPALTKETP